MSRDEPKAGRGGRDELTPHRVHLPGFAADTEVGLGRWSSGHVVGGDSPSVSGPRARHVLGGPVSVCV